MLKLLRLLLACALWLAFPALAPAQLPSTGTEAGRQPYTAMADIWTRALDRIAQDASRPNLIDAEVDRLRTETTAIRQAADAAASQSRKELASLRTLLAPLEAGLNRKGATADAPPPPDDSAASDAVKQQRDKLRADVALVDARVKQAELIVARADLLVAQLARARSDQFARTVLRKGPSPVVPSTWLGLGHDLSTVWDVQAASWRALSSSGILAAALRNDERRDGTIASVFGLLAAWLVLSWARRRHRRGQADSQPSYRERAIAAILEGLGMVAIPVLAILLAVSWLPSYSTSKTELQPALGVLYSLARNAIFFLVVYGFSESSLTPRRPTWRLLPFSAGSATAFCNRVQRLAGFVTIALSAYALLRTADQSIDATNLAAVWGLVIAAGLLVLGLPALRSDAWQSNLPAAGDGPPPLIGGYAWLLGRLGLSAVLIAIVATALPGYTALAIHASDALVESLLLIVLAIMAHGLVHDIVDAIGAPDTPPGRWLRRVFGLAPDATITGRFVIVLLADLVLLAAVAMILPVLWGADPDDIVDEANKLVSGFSIGQHRISPIDIVIALAVFGGSMAAIRIARSALRDRFLPSLHMQDDIRLSIDAAINYAGIVLAFLLAVSVMGIDFRNLALIVGALSVGIGLGLQNLANNTISGVVLLLERPVKVGDRVIVGKHEGIVRRINVRATEIQTSQSAIVIVPNSEFLQSAVVNWTYADNVGRIDIVLSVTHGSDPDKVEAILRQAADENPYVVAVPKPLVMFKAIGPVGLDFELRVHVDNVANTVAAQNGLNRAILAALADAGIAIAVRPLPPPAPPAA